jgi:hypothetical protein
MIRALAYCGNGIHRNIQEFTAIQVSDPWIPVPRFVLCDLGRMRIVQPGEEVPPEDTHVPYFGGSVPPEWPTRVQHKALDFWCLGSTLKRMLAKAGGMPPITYEEEVAVERPSDYILRRSLAALCYREVSMRCAQVAALKVVIDDSPHTASLFSKWTSAQDATSDRRAEERAKILVQSEVFVSPSCEVISLTIPQKMDGRNERYCALQTSRRMMSILGRLREDLHPNTPRLVAAILMPSMMNASIDIGFEDYDQYQSRAELAECGMSKVALALHVCSAVQHCHVRIGFMLRGLTPEDIVVGGYPRRGMLRGFSRCRALVPGWRSYTCLRASSVFRAPEATIVRSHTGLADYCEAVDVYSLGQIFGGPEARPILPELADMVRVDERSRPSLADVCRRLQGMLAQEATIYLGT